MNNQIANAVAEVLGWHAGEMQTRPVSGGSIAGSWRLQTKKDSAFVKTMAASQAEMLDAERDGLERLAGADAIRTPSVLGHGTTDDTAWLALEWLELRPLDSPGFAALGRQLTDLHRCSAARFGLERDNFIGATAQPNTQTAYWREFLLEHRLGFQLDLLADRGKGPGVSARQRLEAALNRCFSAYSPPPALLHGDLWGGNAAMLQNGQPVIFDPAVHFGDRECDLAMADLFGGFDQAFFDAYDEHWPLAPGWEQRRRFYKLYHLLNHANLFGGHYVSASMRLIDELYG